jgi:hypothetical protein
MNALKILFLCLVCLPMSSNAEHSIFLSFDYLQSKDSFNHGILFEGQDYRLGYRNTAQIGNYNIELESALKFGTSKGKGILGLNIAIQPFKLFVGRKVSIINEVATKIGFELGTYYRFSLYPDLQMGDDFWITAYTLSPSIIVEIPVKNNKLRLKLSNSLLSLISRPDEKKDEYYFSLRAGDILRDIHSNFSINLPHSFNYFDFEADYNFLLYNNHFSLGYFFKHLAYLKGPEIRELNHGIKLEYYWGAHYE